VTEDLRLQTNAVRASHPDRIVFAKSRLPLIHARGMGESSLLRLHSEESGLRCYSADFHSRSELREATCSTTVASGQSCRVWRTLEEAATPGQPVRAETRFLEEPS